MVKVIKSDEDWRAILSPLAYEVTRKHATERPFSHNDFPEGDGTYYCICCGTALFANQDRFEAGCGWPAFAVPLANDALEGSQDTSHGMVRTEVHCATCDAHLGHVFPDGPPERGGLRFCINGVALSFEPQS